MADPSTCRHTWSRQHGVGVAGAPLSPRLNQSPTYYLRPNTEPTTRRGTLNKRCHW